MSARMSFAGRYARVIGEINQRFGSGGAIHQVNCIKTFRTMGKGQFEKSKIGLRLRSAMWPCSYRKQREKTLGPPLREWRPG